MNLKDEILAKIDEFSADNKPYPSAWIANAVCKDHADELASGSDFWWYCGYETVQRQTRHLMSKVLEPNNGDAEQFSLPGFDHLQTHYAIRRDGDNCMVPIGQATDDELMKKASEYRSMAEACYAHADEIERYISSRNQSEVI